MPRKRSGGFVDYFWICAACRDRILASRMAAHRCDFGKVAQQMEVVFARDPATGGPCRCQEGELTNTIGRA